MSRSVRHFVFLATFLVTPLAQAAFDTYVFFDFTSCKSYSVSDDPLFGVGGAKEKQYEELLAKTKKLKNADPQLSTDPWKEWSVFSMNDGERIGICTTTKSNRLGKLEFHCQKESRNGFPLAGAGYTAIRNSKRRFTSFGCNKGCESPAPKILYEEVYEGSEGDSDPESIALENAYRRFKEKCKK